MVLQTNNDDSRTTRKNKPKKKKQAEQVNPKPSDNPRTVSEPAAVPLERRIQHTATLNAIVMRTGEGQPLQCNGHERKEESRIMNVVVIICVTEWSLRDLRNWVARLALVSARQHESCLALSICELLFAATLRTILENAGKAAIALAGAGETLVALAGLLARARTLGANSTPAATGRSARASKARLSIAREAA